MTELTSDPNDPRLKEQKEDGTQNSVYLILSEEDRAKGFIRPVRTDYVHVGRLLHYKGVHRILTTEERKEYPDKQYVAVLTVLTDEDGNFTGGSYVNQEEFDAWTEGRRIDGCRTRTTMGRELAETYAANPSFYGATYCCGCHAHLPVSEFVWDGTDETVGS